MRELPLQRLLFDPRESVALWKNMKAASGGAPPEFLSTHPAPDTRIADLQARMEPAVRKYERAAGSGRGSSEW